MQAFDDYPIRVDTQLAAVDVVWKEKRYEMPGMWRSVDNRAPILRRERFQFDEVFWGHHAGLRLTGTCRQLTVDAMSRNKDVCFICLGCGDRSASYEDIGGEGSDPPLALLMGDYGGQGLISGVVDEIFNHLGHKIHPPARLVPSDENPHGRAAQSIQYSGIRASVIMSAVIISGGCVSDLLGGVSVGSPQVKRNQDGRNVLYDVGRLKLNNAADFERVAGVLLGRRSALRQISRSTIHATEDHAAGLVAADDDSCLLISISLLGFGISNNGEGNFYFVCPCGDIWRLPGSEICMLSEAISSLPHPTPPSLLNNSILTQLLTVIHLNRKPN